MSFDEIVEKTIAVLQQQGRVSYRALKRRFELEDEVLADLKEELLFSFPQVKDEDDRGLVWVGEQAVVSSPQPVVSREKKNSKGQKLPIPDSRPLTLGRTRPNTWRTRFCNPAPPWKANANK